MTDLEQGNVATLAALVTQCTFAVLAGQPTVTIAIKGKRPAGFPRGELLSVGSDGSHNYAVHPIKVMTWIHSTASRSATIPTEDSK
jgi:hypothetical protein